jgi:hypothetical protein
MNRNPDPRLATLEHVLETLVQERQRLRAEGADPLALDGNRREIVKRQHELAAALIAVYGARPEAA